MTIEAALRSALHEAATVDRLLVVMDFDGTLSELVDDPDAARPVAGAVEVLCRLARTASTNVVVLSGRARDDLARVAGMCPEVDLVGSHGAEDPHHPGAPQHDDAHMAALAAVTEELRGLARGVEGAWVELKPSSAVFHYRLVAEAHHAELIARLDELRDRAGALAVTPGKCVVEFATPGADKGRALDRARSRVGARRVVFAGDDITDEAAVRALRPDDVSIKVGPGATGARHRVADPARLVDVLEELAAARASYVSEGRGHGHVR